MPYHYSFCYHSVGHPGITGLSISTSEFEKQVQFLISTGKPIIKVEDNSNYNIDTINLTFDDGYADNFETAVPILNKYNVPGTFYITSGAIKKNEKVISRMRNYSHSLTWMNEKNILELFNMGHEIGNHTHSHACLAALTKYEIISETLQCQEIIRDITGQYPTSMAVPFGRKKHHILENQMDFIYKIGINNIALLYDLPGIDQNVLYRMPISQKTKINDIKRYLVKNRTIKNHIKRVIPDIIWNKLNNFETKVCKNNSESFF